MKPLHVLFLALLLCTFLTDARTSDSAETLVAEALSYLDNDLDEAEEIINQALALHPDNPEVHFTCGRIMGKQAENAFFSALSYAGKSLTCLQQAVQLAPDETRYRTGLLNFYLGAPSMAGGDIEAAKKQVDEIDKLNPLHGAKAEIKYLQSTEQHTVLKQRLQAMADTFPLDPEINLRHGLLLQEEKQYDAAFSAFKAATESGDNSTYYLNALYQLGRNAVFSELYVQEGIDGLLRLVEEFDASKNIPSLEWAYLRLAQLYQLQKNPERVNHYADLASHSSERDLHRALKRLQEKQDQP